MKLIFCPDCGDVRKLGRFLTFCDCSKSYGMYQDDIHAIVGGRAIPLGIHNGELVKAICHRPHKAYSKKNQFTSWVIALPCPTVRRYKR